MASDSSLERHDDGPRERPIAKQADTCARTLPADADEHQRQAVRRETRGANLFDAPRTHAASV